MELIGKKYFQIPETYLLTDGSQLYTVKCNKKWESKIVDDEYIGGGYKIIGKSLVPADTWKTEIKQEYGVNIVYWSSGEVKLKKAKAIALAMLGRCPKGYCLKFKDGDTKNAVIDNLEYAKTGRPKKAIRKPGDFITYDKSKKKFRHCHPLLPRKQFATKDEAQTKLNEALALIENDDDISDDVSVADSEILEIEIDD